MAKQNRTRFALLGLLASESLTGYEMKKKIDGSLNHFWKISFGQIYPTLNVLVEAGEVEGEEENGSTRYKLTEAGRMALTGWLRQVPDELPVQKNELLLKLFFSRHEDHRETIKKLEKHEQLLTARLEVYEQIELSLMESCGSSPDLPYWLLTVRHGIAVTEAGLDWCRQSITFMKE
ncbi:PadR family transcriptional regulator [Alkalicoccus luteus]|uniref:PadR family transcriptional regulator n=1 Tax=Alkalicoccus luteus TaxID=1237094 RepID=UPI00403447BC